jgi:hypothetical protein
MWWVTVAIVGFVLVFEGLIDTSREKILKTLKEKDE